MVARGLLMLMELDLSDYSWFQTCEQIMHSMKRIIKYVQKKNDPTINDLIDAIISKECMLSIV